MNISRNWLADYVTIGCDIPTLCTKLTMAGIEVEAVESAGTVPAGVVVGKILDRKPHPNSDHMSVCNVDIGKGEPLQIVCGAPNCDADRLVPVAVIGTTFHTPDGSFKIKKSKLRGIDSMGMMCSERELGLSNNHDGLMILDPSLKLGTPVNTLYPGDTKIEVEVTPNRPDWLSMWGIARDVSCLLDTPAHLPEIKIPSCSTPAPGLVTVEAPDLCRRYIGRIIRNVKIGPSPKWIVERLESVGLRSINNVVDVTNFVLMELGQPLHAFDLNKLEGKRVVARRAHPGEKITTLDGKTFELQNRHLVIADAIKPMALAGVMGGLDSGVSDSTTDVLIESAVFLPSNIRATSHELGISTDSSYRYERGVDYDMTSLASDRAVQLILATAGGELATEKVDITPGRPEEKTIPCRFDRIRSLIGTPVSNERMIDILRKLHLQVTNITNENCLVTAPLFRLDLEREADLAEEVARINGLDNIPEIPVVAKCCGSMSEDAYHELQTLRDRVIELGFFECMHYSMVNLDSALADRRFQENDLIHLKNPLSLELAVLRPGLLGEMLGTIERNISRRNLNLELFEIGKVFCATPERYPEERLELCMVLTGLRQPERYSEELEQAYDFYDLKGALESLFELANVKRYKFVVADDARFRSSHAAEIWIEGKKVGHFGELADDLVGGWRTTYPVFVAQLDATALMVANHGKGYYAPFSLFPATSRDVAFIADEKLEHGFIMDFIRKCHLTDLESARLFDIFIDDKLKSEHRKSMAYQLTFRNAERTLTDTEINSRLEKLREKLAHDLKVELR